MKSEREQEIEAAKLVIGQIFNDIGAYDAIMEVAQDVLCVVIDINGEFFHDIEELIVKRILEEGEE